MVRYFDGDKVKETGRQLIDSQPSFNKLVSQLRPGEKLTGIYFNGLWEACPHLVNAYEVDHFEEAYRNGSWLRRNFYAVTLDPK
jgi:hypothetical protein